MQDRSRSVASFRLGPPPAGPVPVTVPATDSRARQPAHVIYAGPAGRVRVRAREEQGSGCTRVRGSLPAADEPQ
jgi:hypothetical protein